MLQMPESMLAVQMGDQRRESLIYHWTQAHTVQQQCLASVRGHIHSRRCCLEAGHVSSGAILGAHSFQAVSLDGLSNGSNSLRSLLA